MKKLIELLQDIFNLGNVTNFKIIGEVSGTNHAAVRINSLTGHPLTWDTPIEEVDFSMQTLTVGTNGYFPGTYRIDNAHGTIHDHTSGALALGKPLEINNLSGAITLGLNFRNNLD